MRTILLILVVLCVLLLAGCGQPYVKHELHNVPGPTKYAHIPVTHTVELKRPVKPERNAVWTRKDGTQVPVQDNEAVRGYIDAQDEVIDRCFADRAAVKKLSDKAVKRSDACAGGVDE